MFNIVQGFGGAGLGDADDFSGPVDEAVVVQCNQKTQLLETKARGDGFQGWHHRRERLFLKRCALGISRRKNSIRLQCCRERLLKHPSGIANGYRQGCTSHYSPRMKCSTFNSAGFAVFIVSSCNPQHDSGCFT